MEKQKFMKKLKRELQWHLSSAELRKVMQKYDGYFTAASGSNVDTVIAELGDPSLVAAEILSERYGTVKNPKTTRGLLFALVVFAFTCFVYLVNPYMGNPRFFFHTNDMGYLNDIQLLLLTPTVIAFLIYPRIKVTRPPSITKLVIANATTIALGSLCFVCINQSIFLAVNDINAFYSHPVWGRMTPGQLGPFAANILFAFGIALALLTIYVMLVIVHGAYMAIPLLYINCTGLCNIYLYMMLLRQMSSPDALAATLYYMVKLIIVGLVVAFIVFVLLLMIMRKRKSE